MSTIAAGRRVRVLPLLLTAAYHAKADIPRLLTRVASDFPRLQVSYGDTLGPHPRLLRALERRLAEVDPDGDRARTGVVLAAAGSSDPEANATIGRLAALWQDRAGWLAVRPAYASAADPSPPAAVRARRPLKASTSANKPTPDMPQMPPLEWTRILQAR